MKDIELQFTKMVKEHRKTIYTVCYFFSKDTEEVNDLYQEILINLCGKVLRNSAERVV